MAILVLALGSEGARIDRNGFGAVVCFLKQQKKKEKG